MNTLNSFNTKDSFILDKLKYEFFSLQKFFKNNPSNLNTLPYCIKILIENSLRNEDGKIVNKKNINNFLDINSKKNNSFEIAYFPSRILMQDFTGVPAVADLFAMRNLLNKKGLKSNLINPSIPVDLIVDHSVSVDSYAKKNSYLSNVEKEFQRNIERYKFLKWSQNSFKNFKVIPPGVGICHQINLEYLGQSVWTKNINGSKFVYPDSLVGTDSHTTMINALSVLGWGVGGIEAEAAMMGQPITMNLPKVVGVNLIGKLSPGITATDLVLSITEKLRKKNVVGKFVEFYGKGLDSISLADRATISNMAPEYGATCGFFPIDNETLKYLDLTGKSNHHINLVKKYSKLQGLWRDDSIKSEYNENILINLDLIQSCLAGPKRPQDKILLKDAPQSFKYLSNNNFKSNFNNLQDGSVVIAAITSCTNTSNPSVLVAAGLVAKKAKERGLQSKKWVKTSFAPGSKVVTEYLKKSGLLEDLNFLGFNIVGYGCTTCIGNSGPLNKDISKKIKDNNLTVCSVLSGNRNFEGRIHSEVKANYLASPPLVVIYALTGNINVDITSEPLGKDKNNKNVYLSDLWPQESEIQQVMAKYLNKKIFKKKYKNITIGDDNWNKIKVSKSPIYKWDLSSTYVKEPPFFAEELNTNQDIIKAKILVKLGDSITTDHISPAGSINSDSPAGKYLLNRQVSQNNFNSYGSRRGNHEVMLRGTFGNIRLKNELVPNTEGGITKYFFDGKKTSIFEAAMKYRKNNIPLVVLAGKEYGTGSSRDWAAKGTRLLGVRAVIAESFERIHRSNLIGMGVLPLEFTKGQNRKNLFIRGDEEFTIMNIKSLKPKKTIICEIKNKEKIKKINLLCRIDTAIELQYFQAGGILHYILNKILLESK